MTIQAQILKDLSEILSQILQEPVEDLDITRDTSFQEDLELESIEMVAMGDLIQEHYAKQGVQLDFVGWLTRLSLQELLLLKVGDLVDWIVTQVGELV